MADNTIQWSGSYHLTFGEDPGITPVNYVSTRESIFKVKSMYVLSMYNMLIKLQSFSITDPVFSSALVHHKMLFLYRTLGGAIRPNLTQSSPFKMMDSDLILVLSGS